MPTTTRIPPRNSNRHPRNNPIVVQMNNIVRIVSGNDLFKGKPPSPIAIARIRTPSRAPMIRAVQRKHFNIQLNGAGEWVSDRRSLTNLLPVCPDVQFGPLFY
jgi:hypothetical protein